MKWRETPTFSSFHLLVFLSISSVGVFLLFYLSVLLAVLCVGVSLHFICRCFSPILSIGVAGSFICWCLDKIGEKHRQIKWRETPTHKTASNTDR
jgi:hypothetical protein